MESPYFHILGIFSEYTTPTRLLQSFTNLSNTVIQTALSGQSKFVFEILQNADDAYNEYQESIEVQFIVNQGFLIVHHNGKGFNYNDVERICDYASQIEEVKSTDLSKTGYKGLGFKSLFNLSDTIYIYSNGYSFRFDKTAWPNPDERPWQVIPMWCRVDELPLYGQYHYDSPVNIMLRLKDSNELKSQLKELVDHPDLFLYLHRVDKLRIQFNDQDYYLERKIEAVADHFYKVVFLKNHSVESTWLIRTYEQHVPKEIKKCIEGASRFVYPEKIKTAEKVNFTFALKSNETLTEISEIKGFCYSTLPTQLHLTLPYHINSFFILNLDRTQLHENEWNLFLIEAVGHFQLYLLRDLVSVGNLKNYVIALYRRKIDHPIYGFSKAFANGFMKMRGEIAWLPSYNGKRLLKLGEAWNDDIKFFKQNFEKIKEPKIYPYLIDYDVLQRSKLLHAEGEVKVFTLDKLINNLRKYLDMLSQNGHKNFIAYFHAQLRKYTRIKSKLKSVPFLVTKNKSIVAPRDAVIEEIENPIPDFTLLNPIDNEYLPLENREQVKEWLREIGARRLKSPVEVIRESIVAWIEAGFDTLEERIQYKTHIDVMHYLSKNIYHFNPNSKEFKKLKDNLLVLTEADFFKYSKLCYLPDAVPVKELADVIDKNEKLSSTYDMCALRDFFIHIGVNSKLKPLDVLRRSIFVWLQTDEIWEKITVDNFKPIINYIALNYFSISITREEKKLLKKLPVLTLGRKLHKAEFCYFDSFTPKIKGLERVIAPDKLVSSTTYSTNVKKFLTEIGVATTIKPVDLLRKSVLKWIQDREDLTKRITHDNHLSILEYIAKQWYYLKSGLKQREMRELRKIIILTQDSTFHSAYSCYWPLKETDDISTEKIPGLERVIPPNVLVSSNYDLNLLKVTLSNLGVRNIKFTDIFEKYSSHLYHTKNLKWFFHNLVVYWKKFRGSPNTDTKLLCYLQDKFKSPSCLLAKNMKRYCSSELYSSKFEVMQSIDPDSIPVLAYNGHVPEDLEYYLGFQTELSLPCILNLLKTLERKQFSGEENTFRFAKTLLEQLKLKPVDEVKSCNFSLFSKENKLVPAVKLYYFREENDTCELTKCYLKRISGMSHEETLELAELCGVNVVSFNREVIYKVEVADFTLKTFYMARLPFIVVQESRYLNETLVVILERLYKSINSINLYQCRSIQVVYPFGEPINQQFHFNNLTLYIEGKNWKRFRTKINNHLKTILNLKTDIGEIIDMNIASSEEIQDWLNEQGNEDRKKYLKIKADLQKIILKKDEENELPLFFGSKSVGNDFKENESSESEELSVDSSSDPSSDEESSINTSEIIDTGIDSSNKDDELYSTNMKRMNSFSEQLNAMQKVTNISLIDKDVRDFSNLSPHNFNRIQNKAIKKIKESIKDSRDRNLIDEFNPKRLQENFTFTLLQNYYRKKYPNSKCKLNFGNFTLKWLSHKIDVIWLNEIEDIRYPYDIVIRKDGKIKQLIEVGSAELIDNDLFMLSHKNMSKSFKKLPTGFREYYCYCCVLNSIKKETVADERLIAVYKIVPMMIKSH